MVSKRSINKSRNNDDARSLLSSSSTSSTVTLSSIFSRRSRSGTSSRHGTPEDMETVSPAPKPEFINREEDYGHTTDGRHVVRPLRYGTPGAESYQTASKLDDEDCEETPMSLRGSGDFGDSDIPKFKSTSTKEEELERFKEKRQHYESQDRWLKWRNNGTQEERTGRYRPYEKSLDRPLRSVRDFDEEI